MDDPSDIPFATRRKLLFYAWGIAALATVLVEIPLLIYFFLFPDGLIHVFNLVFKTNLDETFGITYYFLCVLYLAISGGVLAVKQRVWFMIIFGTLCVLLIFNVVGCHQMLRGVQ